MFALAVERSVPILIHGGRGLPPIAEDLEALVRRNEGVQLIVAHAGIADMAGLAGRLGGIPGSLLRHVRLERARPARPLPPGRAGAGDLRLRLPVRRQPNSLLVAVRTAKLAGFDDKQLRLMLGGSARRMIAGEELEPLSTPRAPTSLVQPLTFARIHQYISMAVPMLWLRQRDAIGAIGLAVNASRERSNGHPEGSERIEELLVTAQELWRAGAEIEDDDERVATFRAAIQLVNLADMVSPSTDARGCGAAAFRLARRDSALADPGRAKQYGVVVDHADGLHERVDPGRPDEAEAAPLQILRDRLDESSVSAGISASVVQRLTIGSPSTKRPEVRVETSELLLQPRAHGPRCSPSTRPSAGSGRCPGRRAGARRPVGRSARRPPGSKPANARR